MLAQDIIQTRVRLLDPREDELTVLNDLGREGWNLCGKYRCAFYFLRILDDFDQPLFRYEYTIVARQLEITEEEILADKESEKWIVHEPIRCGDKMYLRRILSYHTLYARVSR